MIFYLISGKSSGHDLDLLLTYPEHEGEEMKLQKRNNSLYEENKKMYLRINADCKLCPKKDPVHYVIMIKKKTK